MKQYILEHAKGLLQRTLYTLAGETTLGRSSKSTITLDGADISRVHAKLSMENGQWVIKDLNSRNGVFVNEEKVDSQVLRHGDRIRLGQATLRFLELIRRDEKRALLDTREEILPEGSKDIQDQMDLVATFLDALPIGVAILNSRYEVCYRNRALGNIVVSGEERKDPQESLGFLLGCRGQENKGLRCGSEKECEECPLRGPLARSFFEGLPTVDLEIPWMLREGASTTYMRFSVYPLPYRLTGEALAMLTWEDITPRRLAQEALSESEQKFRSLVENMADTVFTMDPGGAFTFWSRNAAALTGYPVDRLLSMRYGDLLSPSSAKLMEQQLDVCMSGETIEPFEIVMLHASGHPVYVELNASPLKGEDGEIIGFQGIARDITERKRAGEALKESELRYRTLFEEAQDAIFVMEGEIVLDCNPAAERLFNRPRQELLGGSPFRFSPPEQPDGKPSNEKGKGFISLALKGFPQSFEWVHMTPDNRTFNAEVSISRISIGGEFRLLVLARDISEQKRAEEVRYLEKERERLSVILDGNPIPTFVIDRDHRVALWNRACESLTSKPREEILGKPLDLSSLYQEENRPVLADLVLDKDDEQISRQYGPEGVVKDETHPETYTGTERIWVKGEQRILTVVATRLRDSRGEVIGAIQSAQDITEREHLQRQLQHAQKMEAMGTLAGGIAHEFNNILAAIQAYAQLMLLGMDPEEPMSEYLNEIKESCERAAGLTNKMLTFSRLEEGEKVPAKVNHLVESVHQLLRQTLPPQIELDSELQGGLPFVMIEPNQLEQVLLNLGLNARDAMPYGGKIRFFTRLAELDEAFCRSHPWAKVGKYVEIAVEDTGEGMKPQVMERIFEPFFTTKEPGKGTGLGLSIAYSIVKNHGGYILAESKEGWGSRFRIYLPIPEEEQFIKRSRSASEQGALCRGNGERLLVVDDEEKLRKIAHRMLESNGYRVSLASNGEEALVMYQEAMGRQERYDAVILDIAMPVMDGEMCLDRLLEIDPGARVIVLTGHGGEQLNSESIQKKTGKIIYKPFDLQVLLRQLRDVLA